MAEQWDPNLKDVNKAKDIIITITLFIVLTTLSTGTRISTKLWRKVRFGVDDYSIIFAYICNIAADAFDYLAAESGFGRHSQFLTMEQRLASRKWNQIALIFSILSLWAVKISICFFLLALIQNTHYRAHIILWGLIVFTTLFAFAQGVIWGTQARPLRKLWEPEVPGTLASEQTFVTSTIIFTAFNSLSNLFYALSPLYFFGTLKISLRYKIPILALTGSGLIIVAMSAVRMGFYNRFLRPDATWSLRVLYLCGIIERNLGEFIADLPALYPHARSLFRKAISIFNTRAQKTNKDEYPAYDPSFARSRSTRREEEARKKMSQMNPFAAYGRAAQIASFNRRSIIEIEGNEWSDDALPLNHIDVVVGKAGESPDEAEPKMNMNEIKVTTDVTISTTV